MVTHQNVDRSWDKVGKKYLRKYKTQSKKAFWINYYAAKLFLREKIFSDFKFYAKKFSLFKYK